MKIQYVFLCAAVFVAAIYLLFSPPGGKSWKQWAKQLIAEEDDPNEPVYDPVHIGAAVILNLAALGALYWLLWTLLVFEGGIFLKMKSAAKVLFTSATLKDLGYEHYPYQMGAFEGWIGNAIALMLTAALIAAMHHLYRRAEKARNRS